jgi:hypothetical protein
MTQRRQLRFEKSLCRDNVSLKHISTQVKRFQLGELAELVNGNESYDDPFRQVISQQQRARSSLTGESVSRQVETGQIYKSPQLLG